MDVDHVLLFMGQIAIVMQSRARGTQRAIATPAS